MVHKSVNSHHDVDIDLEAATAAAGSPIGVRVGPADRTSTYTLTTDGGCSSLLIPEDKDTGRAYTTPISPATAAAKAWMRPPSIQRGPYETTSELVTVVPAADGRRVMVVTPTPGLSSATVGGGGVGRPGSPAGLSRQGSINKGDIFGAY